MKSKIILATSGALSVVALMALSLVTPSQSQAPDAASKLAHDGAVNASVGSFQSEVASNKHWNTISSSDARLSTAIAATDVASGRSLLGQRGAMQGTVTSIHIPSSNSITIVRFGRQRNDALMAVVRPTDYTKFPPLSGLEGQKVLIEGLFEIYHNRHDEDLIEVVLNDPSQVSIVR